MDVDFPLENEFETLLCTIPNSWILDNGHQVYFPPYKGNKINLAAINGEIPKKTTWTILTAKSHSSFGNLSCSYNFV